MVKKNVLEFLADLVRFPSLSHQEDEIATFVYHFLQTRGVQVFRHANNVWCELGNGDDVLLLNSHLDVVPVSNDHPFPPFEPTIHDGKLYGRGAVDAKGCGSSMLFAFLALFQEGFIPKNGKIIVALTACEEASKDYNGLQDIRPLLPKLSAALVGEPTNFQPCVAQKGLLILNLHAKGKTAHAARGHLGENAILKAARDILTLSTFDFPWGDETLGKPTMHVTMIEGGTAHNIIPDWVKMKVDIRSTPPYSHPEIVQLVQSQIESEVEVHSDRIIPVGTPLSAKIVQTCLKALPNAVPFGSPTASDWIFLHDVPTVKIGPGFSELSHTPNEHIALQDVLEAVQGYKDIIKTYFDNE